MMTISIHSQNQQAHIRVLNYYNIRYYPLLSLGVVKDGNKGRHDFILECKLKFQNANLESDVWRLCNNLSTRHNMFSCSTCDSVRNVRMHNIHEKLYI